MGAFFILLFLLPLILSLIELITYNVKTRQRYFGLYAGLVMDIITVIVWPIFYLNFIDETSNDCCSESATFSPEHRFSIYTLIVICVIAYFYSRYKSRIASPILEVLSNVLLLIGIIFNIFIAIQVGAIALFGNLAIIVLFSIQLGENHLIFLANSEGLAELPSNGFEKFLWRILSLKPLTKIPVLFLLAVPVMTLIIGYLMLFGQKPDALIRAFTDTYKHGFSQLDYLCANVECGDHFLCSVAANGHEPFVKPERWGERGGKPIICNRQLLVSNAFEELIEQRFPRLHRLIRRNYNKVGNVVHRYYGVFSNKWFADFIYILMKPLEWCFVLVLYTFDTKPEDRIAQQYLKRSERQAIKELLSNKD